MNIQRSLLLLLIVISCNSFSICFAEEEEDTQFGFAADDSIQHDRRHPIPDFVLPDNKPYGQDFWLTFRFLPMALVSFGEIKEGPRGETETLEFERDLDLNPWLFGYTLETKAYFNRRFTIGLEYQKLQSASQGRHTHQQQVTRFDGLNIPQGDRTRSELSYEWIRAEIGLVFHDDWFYVELLFGGRFTATKLRVNGRNGDEVGRQKSFNLLLPGAIAALRVHKRYWAQLELRNSFISWPFGHQLTDGRLSIFYLHRDVRIGIGGQFTSLIFFRNKKVFRQRRVNNYRYFEITATGLFLDVQFSF